MTPHRIAHPVPGFTLAVLVIASLIATTATRLRAQVTPAAVGSWTGTIATPGTPLAIGVTLQAGIDGAWTGTMDIPAQGATGLPLRNIVVDGMSVSFGLAAGAGNPTVTARVSDDGSRMSGTFTQSGASFPLELKRGTAAAPVLNRPQEPKRPFPYLEEEVTYRNEAARIRLAGTLTRPRAGSPFPAVVLITGSGAQDRDETILGHKPFLVLADHLTRQGLAVLRVDDRGVGGSDLGPLTATSRDFAGDALAGVNYLKSRSDIDAKRIGLIGHSEGANIAAMAAASNPEVRFIVMMAGSGIPGDRILYQQAEAIARIQGASPEVIAWDRSIRQGVYELVKSEANGTADEARRRALVDNAPAAPGAPATSGREMTNTLLKAASGPWFRFFLSYDPAPTIRSVPCPVLAVIGENDIQVPALENIPAIRAALEAGGNRDHTVVSLPRLNHLFQTSVTGAVAEYGTIEETLAPSFLALLSDWIALRSRS